MRKTPVILSFKLITIIEYKMKLRLFFCFGRIGASTLFIVNGVFNILMSMTQLGLSVYGIWENHQKLDKVIIYSLGITTSSAWLFSILYNLISFFCYSSFGTMTNINYLYSRFVYFVLFVITLWLVLVVLKYPTYIALITCVPICVIIDWNRQLMTEAKRQFDKEGHEAKLDSVLSNKEANNTILITENNQKEQGSDKESFADN